MPRGSTPKQERQYQHIRQSAEDRGQSPRRAAEIAARTVNKERARAGGSRAARPASRTRDQLYAEARRRGIPGRSGMTRAQLEHALAR